MLFRSTATLCQGALLRALDTGVSVYDTLFVELATQASCPLLTFDKAILRAFPEIARRVKVFCEANPEAAKRLIRCGIGDVTEPLPAAVIAALHQAVDEMANRATFRGYGPEQGYDFLRGAIAKNDFRDKGLDVADDEVFVSDG